MVAKIYYNTKAAVRIEKNQRLLSLRRKIPAAFRKSAEKNSAPRRAELSSLPDSRE